MEEQTEVEFIRISSMRLPGTEVQAGEVLRRNIYGQFP
jgi:hypothetical protein